MAIGKNKRVSKGGKRGNKKKVVEPMSKKEWFDVVAPRNFKNRQFAKTLCNKTIGIRTVADNMKGRVYEGNLADLDGNNTKDQPFKKIKLQVQELAGRNLLTTFHSMSFTTDKIRSLFRKWCTLIDTVVDAQTKDGFVVRFFVVAFTARQKGQLSKNCYARGKLESWVRLRITRMIKKRIGVNFHQHTIIKRGTSSQYAHTHRTVANILHLSHIQLPAATYYYFRLSSISSKMLSVLRKVNPAMMRFASTSAYRRTYPLSKGAGLHLKDFHLKEKVITAEKSLAVLAVAALALMLPPPYSVDSGLEPGITEIDCLSSLEEPFDSH